MKKLLALATMSALTLSVFGQGQVSFNNRNTGATPNQVVAPIYSLTVGGTLLSGTDTTLHAALLGGASTLTPAYIPGSRTNGASGGQMVQGTLNLLLSPSTSATWVTFRTGTLAGAVAVGTDSARDSGLAYASTGLFQVVAWNGGYTTWAAAFAAAMAGTPGVLIGASNALLLPTTLNATDLNVPTLQGLESFAIVPVPEPSAFALAGLGAAALLIFRRRK